MISNQLLQWNKIPQLYTENMIKSKKLPIYFDFYDLGKDFNNVYEPAEDTFLMIDCLNLELDKIIEKIKQDKMFYSTEIGCGSGLVSSYFVSLIKNQENLFDKSDFKHFCVDVNDDALNLTKNLFENYSLNSEVYFIKSDLFTYFADNQIKLDLIFFNPPYVTTDYEEMQLAQEKKDISAAWAGGSTGSEITYKFINQLESVLQKTTIVYLLLSDENEYNQIIQLMKEKYDFRCECLLKRKAKNESLGVFKFSTNS